MLGVLRSESTEINKPALSKKVAAAVTGSLAAGLSSSQASRIIFVYHNKVLSHDGL